jgi:hypothetical protein
MKSFTLFGVASCCFYGFLRNVSKLRQTTQHHISEGSTRQCNEVLPSHVYGILIKTEVYIFYLGGLLLQRIFKQ